MVFLEHDRGGKPAPSAFQIGIMEFLRTTFSLS
eukprot:COSAG02_NODE_54305_length_296_cov_40.116751_1_plen_32_part_01